MLFNKTTKQIAQEIAGETAKTIPQITNYHTGGVFRLFIETVAVFIFNIYTALNHMLPNIKAASVVIPGSITINPTQIARIGTLSAEVLNAGLH